MRARRIAAAAACTAVAASLCVIPASAQEGPAAQAVRTLATNLDIPWDIEFAPDGSGIFTERDTHKIKQLRGTTVTELDTVEQAQTTGGEGGLLGLALSKSFATDNTVYIGTPESVFTGYGRVRSVAAAPDGTLWLGTSNQDDNGSPGATDDRILSTDG